MDVAIAINNAYTEYAIILMVSLYENNKDLEIKFHILTNDLKPKNKSLILSYASKYNRIIYFHQIDDTEFKGLDESYSLIAYYRLLLPELIPGKKVLYLDTDIVINGSIKELSKINIENYSLAAVRSSINDDNERYNRLKLSPKNGYFNSGVMLINLDYWRVNNIKKQVIEYLRNSQTKLVFPDQDALNVINEHTKFFLPLKYNVIQTILENPTFIKLHYSEVVECIENPIILHYAGMKPWYIDEDFHFASHIWHKYNSMSIKSKTKCHKKGIRKIIYILQYYVIDRIARRNHNKRIIKEIIHSNIY